MKNFKKPFCEVVKFSSGIIATSACGCWDGEDDWGFGSNCTGDTPKCACEVNYSPAEDNCIPNP